MGIRRMVQAVSRLMSAGAGGQPPGNIIIDPTTGNTAVVGLNPADPTARVVQVIGGYTATIAPTGITAGTTAVVNPSVAFELTVTRNGASAVAAPVLGELVMISWAVPGDQAGVLLTSGSLASYAYTNLPTPQTFAERGTVFAVTNAAGRIAGKVVCISGSSRNVTGNVLIVGVRSALIGTGAEGIQFGLTP